MNDQLQSLCDAFIARRDVVKSVFPWDSAYLYPVSAVVLLRSEPPVTKERLLECRALLRRETGAFSDFRGTAAIATVSMLAASRDPEERFRRARSLYGAFRKHFTASQFLPVASMILSESVEEAEYAAFAERTRAIYNAMRREHPFLTSSEDSVFAAMLALSKDRDSDVILETERCYLLLKKELTGSNAGQSLSHVLALFPGRAEEKCERTVRLYRRLKEAKCRYGLGYELPTLGVLATLPLSDEELLSALTEVDTYLRRQKGYKGIFGMTGQQRLMHASMIVSAAYGEEQSTVMNGASLGCGIATVAAEQAAMLAAIAASVAATTASSSSH